MSEKSWKPQKFSPWKFAIQYTFLHTVGNEVKQANENDGGSKKQDLNCKCMQSLFLFITILNYMYNIIDNKENSSDEDESGYSNDVDDTKRRGNIIKMHTISNVHN